MQSQATTVEQYLAELPEDRRAAISAVRNVILKNLNKGYEEGMQYGMIGYYVPHSLYPAGYHCDPKQPLPFACLASQKNYMSLYMMPVYCDDATETTFRDEWIKAGKKLDMGKSCIRFKKVEDLALDLIGETIRRTSVKQWVEHYETVLKPSRTKAVRTKTAASSKPLSVKKKMATKKAAPKKKATKK